MNWLMGIANQSSSLSWTVFLWPWPWEPAVGFIILFTSIFSFFFFGEIRNLTTLCVLPLVNNGFSLSSFFLSLLSYLWIGAQFPQEKFLSYGRILTLHYYFLLMCILFSFIFCRISQCLSIFYFSIDNFLIFDKILLIGFNNSQDISIFCRWLSYVWNFLSRFLRFSFDFHNNYHMISGQGLEMKREDSCVKSQHQRYVNQRSRISWTSVWQRQIWLRFHWCVTDGVRKEKERLTAASWMKSLFSIYFTNNLMNFIIIF